MNRPHLGPVLNLRISAPRCWLPASNRKRLKPGDWAASYDAFPFLDSVAPLTLGKGHLGFMPLLSTLCCPAQGLRLSKTLCALQWVKGCHPSPGFSIFSFPLSCLSTAVTLFLLINPKIEKCLRHVYRYSYSRNAKGLPGHQNCPAGYWTNGTGPHRIPYGPYNWCCFQRPSMGNLVL